MTGEILLIPDKVDVERDALAKSWRDGGGEVLRIGKFWIKPELGNREFSLYGNDSFCLVLAQLLGVDLIIPRDEMIVKLERRFIKRDMQICPISSIGEFHFPLFVKPVTPKLFKAAVYTSQEELSSVLVGLDPNEQLICSEVIKIEKEVRSFILDRKIADLAFYEGEGELEKPKRFLDDFLSNSNVDLPKTFVVDLGYNHKLGWFIIEFNSSWGAGLNNCNPSKVIACIREAVV